MVVLDNHYSYLYNYYTIPRVPLGLDFNHLAIKGKMVQLVFHASDDHEPFMK
jgi:hypothetical protein